MAIAGISLPGTSPSGGQAIQGLLGGLNPGARAGGQLDPNVLMQWIQMIMQLLQQGNLSQEQAQQALKGLTGGMGGAGEAGAAGGPGNAGNAGNAGGAEAAAGMSAPMAAAGQAQEAMSGARQLGDAFAGILGSGGPVVAVLDDFSQAGGHGDEIAGLIAGGGATAAKYNINTGGDLAGNIANSLSGVISRVQNGAQVDAVNLSQQSFQDSGNSAAVQQRIAQLQAMGIPVVVAAGNGGPGQQNALARGAALQVENSARGSEARASSSGIGNVRSEGAFTSQATANVSVQAARAHTQGQSVQQIQQTVQQQAAAQGGSLNAR